MHICDSASACGVHEPRRPVERAERCRVPCSTVRCVCALRLDVVCIRLLTKKSALAYRWASPSGPRRLRRRRRPPPPARALLCLWQAPPTRARTRKDQDPRSTVYGHPAHLSSGHTPVSLLRGATSVRPHSHPPGHQSSALRRDTAPRTMETEATPRRVRPSRAAKMPSNSTARRLPIA